MHFLVLSVNGTSAPISCGKQGSSPRSTACCLRAWEWFLLQFSGGRPVCSCIQLSLLVLDPSHYKNKRKWNFFTVLWVLKIDQFKLGFGMWNASYLAQIVQKLVAAHTAKWYNLVMLTCKLWLWGIIESESPSNQTNHSFLDQ